MRTLFMSTASLVTALQDGLPRRVLNQREIAALVGVRDGRAIRANEKGPALTPEEFGTATELAMPYAGRLTRIIPRSEGGPGLELTEAGVLALASQETTP